MRQRFRLNRRPGPRGCRSVRRAEARCRSAGCGVIGAPSGRVYHVDAGRIDGSLGLGH
jgi:hypothetical protein